MFSGINIIFKEIGRFTLILYVHHCVTFIYRITNSFFL